MTLLLTEATDWSAIWSITLVSFGLVLVILFLLVIVMKIFGLFFKEKTEVKPVTAASEQKTAAGSDEETVAAIATAIALAQGALHVEESGVLTFAGDRKTAWNNKAYGITLMPDRNH